MVLLEKGAGAEERKRAEALIAFTAAARGFYTTAFGPPPDVPLRLVAVRRGAGSNDGGTVLFDADTLRLPKLEAATALAVAEAPRKQATGGNRKVRRMCVGASLMKPGRARAA